MTLAQSSSSLGSFYSSQFPVIGAIAQHIQRASDTNLNGSLNFDTVHIPRMRLFFVMGRLVWAGGGQHRFRRWRRLLLRFCPKALSASALFAGVPYGPCWEYQLLGKLIDEGFISREDARTLITCNIVEVLFDIVQASKLIEKFSCTPEELLTPESTITIIPFSSLFMPLEDQWKRWCDARLGQYSPNLSPVLEQPELLRIEVAPETYKRLTQLLQGQYSLRELSVLMKQDLTQLSQSLVAYEQQGWLRLLAKADLKSPAHSESGATASKKSDSSSTSRSVAASTKPKVLCVDDNPQICQQLGQVVEGAGYQYRSLQDSVQALHVALEEKPHLIFIDLVMPVLSGYELCSQFRRISRLKDTPIIILTSNDGVIDRVRGRMVGANEYLTKPASAAQVISTLERWIKQP